MQHREKDFGGYGLKYKRFTDLDAFPVVDRRKKNRTHNLFFETILEKKQLSYRFLSKLMAYLIEKCYLRDCLQGLDSLPLLVNIQLFLVKLLQWSENFIMKYKLGEVPCLSAEVKPLEFTGLKENISDTVFKCIANLTSIRGNLNNETLTSPFPQNDIYNYTSHICCTLEKLFTKTIWREWNDDMISSQAA